MNRYEELEGPLDDAALEEIAIMMQSLTRNGPVAALSQRLNNDGGPSGTEMEQFKKDLMDQRAQLTTFQKKFGEMETKSAKNDIEIAQLHSLLASERESNSQLKAEINRINGEFQMSLECLFPPSATEDSINMLKEDSSRERETKVDAATDAIFKEIESRFTDINLNHTRLSDDYQRLKQLVEESSGKLEKKICTLEMESVTKHSEMNTNLQSLIASEKKVHAGMEIKVERLHAAFKKTLDTVGPFITRNVATEEVVKMLKEKASKVDEAIQVLIKEAEEKFTKVNESLEKFENDIQRVKESVEVSSVKMETKVGILESKSEKNYSEIDTLQSLLESERKGKTEVESITSKMDETIQVLKKEIENKFAKMDENLLERIVDDVQRLKAAQLSFSNVEEGHERVKDELQNIKTTMEEIEKRIHSETQLSATERETYRSKVNDEIQQLNLYVSELRNPEVPLTPAVAEGGDGSIISEEVESRFTKVNEDHEKLIDDLNRMKESLEESDKRMVSNLNASKVSFSIIDDSYRRVTNELAKIKQEVEELQKQMQSEILQFIVPEKGQDDSQRIPIEQLNLTMSNLYQQIKTEIKARPDAVKRGGGSDKDIPVITMDEDEEEVETEENAVPPVQKHSGFTLSSIASRFKISNAVGREIDSNHNENSDPPLPSTHPSTTMQDQNAAQAVDRTKRDGAKNDNMSLSNDGQVKKVQEAPKGVAGSPPKPSKSTSVTGKTIRHGRDPAQHMCCLCGKKFNTTSGLRKHLRKYALGNNFRCKLCPKGFVFESGLKNHVRTSHKDKVSERATAAVRPART